MMARLAAVFALIAITVNAQFGKPSIPSPPPIPTTNPCGSDSKRCDGIQDMNTCGTGAVCLPSGINTFCCDTVSVPETTDTICETCIIGDQCDHSTGITGRCVPSSASLSGNKGCCIPIMDTTDIPIPTGLTNIPITTKCSDDCVEDKACTLTFSIGGSREGICTMEAQSGCTVCIPDYQSTLPSVTCDNECDVVNTVCNIRFPFGGKRTGTCVDDTSTGCTVCIPEYDTTMVCMDECVVDDECYLPSRPFGSNDKKGICILDSTLSDCTLCVPNSDFTTTACADECVENDACDLVTSIGGSSAGVCIKNRWTQCTICVPDQTPIPTQDICDRCYQRNKPCDSSQFSSVGICVFELGLNFGCCEERSAPSTTKYIETTETTKFVGTGSTDTTKFIGSTETTMDKCWECDAVGDRCDLPGYNGNWAWCVQNAWSGNNGCCVIKRPSPPPTKRPTQYFDTTMSTTKDECFECDGIGQQCDGYDSTSNVGFVGICVRTSFSNSLNTGCCVEQVTTKDPVSTVDTTKVTDTCYECDAIGDDCDGYDTTNNVGFVGVCVQTSASDKVGCCVEENDVTTKDPVSTMDSTMNTEDKCFECDIDTIGKQCDGYNALTGIGYVGICMQTDSSRFGCCVEEVTTRDPVSTMDTTKSTMDCIECNAIGDKCDGLVSNNIGICTQVTWQRTGCCMEQDITTTETCEKCDDRNEKCQIVSAIGVETGICIWKNTADNYGCCQVRDPSTTNFDNPSSTMSNSDTTRFGTTSSSDVEIQCGNDEDCDGLTDGDYICKYPRRCRPRKPTSSKYEKCGVCVLDDNDYCSSDDQSTDFMSFKRVSQRNANICDICLCGDETKGGRDCEDVIAAWEVVTDLFKDRLDNVFAQWCPALLVVGEESFAVAGETYPALLNADGEQCLLENVRPRCTTDFDYCGCEALICESNPAYIEDCDEIGNVSGKSKIGYLIGLAVMVAHVLAVWM